MTEEDGIQILVGKGRNEQEALQLVKCQVGYTFIYKKRFLFVGRA